MSTRDQGIDAALWIVGIDCLLAITWNSLGTPPPAFSWPYADKILHLASYFTLTSVLLLAAVWRPGRGPSRFRNAGRVAVVSVTVFGVFIEMAQGVIFERTADAADAAANLLGILLAWAAWRGLKRAALG